MLSSPRPLGYTTLPVLLRVLGPPMARAGRRPPPAWGQRPASLWRFASLALACAGDATTRPYGQEVLLRSPSQPQEAVVFSACLRLGLHKLAFAVASLCVDPAVVRSHAVWVYTDTSALETYEHTSYTVPHIVNRSMWMGRDQERHTAIFVPLGEETGLAIPGVAHTDFGVVPWMWRSEPAKLRNYVEACTNALDGRPHQTRGLRNRHGISGPFLHCWAAEVVAFALKAASPCVPAEGYMPRPTCRRTPRWDAPVWRCRQQQSRGRYCLGLPWPGPAGALLGRGCGE